MQYKVCGITQLEQAQALELMGVDYIGFIFYPASKRYVLKNLTVEQLSFFIPIKAKKVGVFVNEPLENLISIVLKAKLDLVQLHGDEDPLYCSEVKKIVPVIKVFRVGDRLPALSPFETAADYFLFDTDSALYGGTGNHFNWELLKNNEIRIPFFLSGGIGPNDIQGIEIISKTKAGKSMIALDVNSQFEIKPGIKNLEKIKTFINVCI